MPTVRNAARGIAAGLGFVLALGTAPAAERPWIEIRSPHFVVVSDAEEKPARRVTWQFEQIHSLVPRLWPWARVALSKPTLILAARDERSMKALLPKYWESKDSVHPSALLVSGRDRHYIAVRADLEPFRSGSRDEERVNPYRAAYWSYVMLVLRQSFEQELPLWFAFGLTEVFSNTIVRDDDVEVGRVIPWQLQRLREGEFLSFSRLRSVDRSSPYYAQADKNRIFDANAWAFVHYLMFADEGAHQAKLNRFSGLLQAGHPPDRAVAEAFPDLAAVEKGAELYAHSLAFNFVRLKIDLDVKQDGFTVRSLGAAEAAGRRAALHVATNRPAEARALVEAGSGADPASPVVLEAAGLLAELEERAADAKAAFAKAAAPPDASYYALYRHALDLQGPTKDPETLGKVEALLRRSIEGNNLFAFGYSALGQALRQLGKADEALGLVRRAVKLEPAEAYHHVVLAYVLSTLQQAKEARAEAQKALALSSTPQEQANARTLLEYLGQVEAAAARRSEARETPNQPADPAQVEACRTGDAVACGQIAPAYERACGEDNAQACAALGWFHEQGKGLPRDLERAAAFYLMACNLGEKRACVSLAGMQSEGKGVPKDAAAAWATAERLCGEGTNEACTFLATLHLRRGAAKDMARARELLARACAAKDERACSMLKSMPAR